MRALAPALLLAISVPLLAQDAPSPAEETLVSDAAETDMSPTAELALTPPPVMPTEPPGKPDPALATGGTYSVEPTHSMIAWRVNHFGFNDYFGLFGSPTGTLNLDKEKPDQSSVLIEIPVAELFTPNADLTKHLKSKDFFNVDEMPTAQFVSSSVKVNGQRATITGTLTLLGKSNPITFEATFTGAGVNPFNKTETIGFRATTAIKRSDWGMASSIPLVSDRVDLAITVAFEKQV